MTDAADSPGAVPIVALVASRGGLEAFSEVLAALPEDFSAAVLVLQHLESGRESLLAEILAGRTRMLVDVAAHGAPLARGRVYVAPSGRHLSIVRGRTIALDTRPPVNYARPSADILLSSLAETGLSVFAVVLTGHGMDGTAGAVRLRAGGGTVLATDRGSSTDFGMPGAATAAGGVDEVLPLPRIAPRLVELVSHLTQPKE